MKFFNIIIKNKKAIFLTLFSIFLIVLTSYRLKLLVVAAGEDSDVLTSQELALVEENTNSANSNLENKDENMNLVGNQIQEKIENQVQEINKSSDENAKELAGANENKIDEIQQNNLQEVEEINNSKLTYEDSELRVTVSAIKKDSLKGIKEVKVTPILKDSISKVNGLTYSEITKKIENKVQNDNIKNNTQNKLTGFLAYDIKLIDQSGNEKEPDGNVSVSLEYLNIPNEIKENKDLNVSVIHFENQNNLKEYTVDDENQDQKLKLEKNESNEIVKLELETESFSTFTITWTQASSDIAKINFHYVDSHGNEINGTKTPDDFIINSNYTFDINNNGDYVSPEITSNGVEYIFSGAYFDKVGGTKFTKMTFDIGPDAISQNNNIKNVTFFNSDVEVANLDYNELTKQTRAIDVYLVYIYKADKVSITDTIMQNGCLNAVLLNNGEDISDKTGYIFKWSKANENKGNDTSWTEVKQMIAGGKYIITNNGSSINIALDKGANKYYKVDVLKEETNEVFLSEIYQVPYFDDVRNGGFEDLVIEGDSVNKQYANNTKDLVWKTTGIGVGEDNAGKSQVGRDIEIVNGRSTKLSQSFNITKVPEGKQCAELNCEEVGALYQDVLTIPGQNLTWSLAHSARGPEGKGQSESFKDSMYVIIMSTELAEKYDITTQDKVEHIKNSSTPKPNEPNVYEYNKSEIFIQKITDSNVKWNYYQGNFTIPNSQYLTRFFFVAGDTASGNETVGNLLDDVHVGQNITPKIPEYVTVNVTKNVVGVAENQELTNYNLKIKNTNIQEGSSESQVIIKDFSDQAYTWDSSKNCWTQTVQFVIDLGDKDSIISNFSEENGYKILTGYKFINSKYKFNVVQEDEENEKEQEGQGNEIKSITLEKGKTYNLTFTNTFVKQTKSVKIHKIGKEYSNNIEFTKGLNGASFKVTDMENTNLVKNGTTGNDGTNDGMVQFDGLEVGKIYKLEEEAPPTGYYSLEEPIYFKVDENSVVQITDIDGNEKNYNLVSLEKNNIQITNIAHVNLPKAGSSGTAMFKIAGILMITISSLRLYNIK